ncbi:MAG: pentapeptide repeat-containing protein, partial [Actinomycetia bacterium]|nr:pentapeptide repeat-containing protein [Actinomycetes bacterium]
QVAKPPRIPPSASLSGPHRRPSGRADEIEIIDGWAELTAVRLEGEIIDLRAALAVELNEVMIYGCQLVVRPDAELRVRGSRFERCDLSQLRVDALRASALSDCKLMGAELTGVVADVEMVNSQLTLTRFPEAKLKRVAFAGCTMRQVDFFDASLTDVSFDGCDLDEVNLDRARFEAVDLRYASTVDVRNTRDYRGCVITAVQAQAMAIQLADSLGLGIESDATVETQ